MSVTIRVKPGTRDYLSDSCEENETYDDVINRLIVEGAKAQDEAKEWKAIATKLRKELDEAEIDE